LGNGTHHATQAIGKAVFNGFDVFNEVEVTLLKISNLGHEFRVVIITISEGVDAIIFRNWICVHLANDLPPSISIQTIRKKED